MTTTMTIALPYPPSANKYWRSIGRGRVLLSKEGRNYKQAVAILYYRANLPSLTGEIIVHLDLFRPQKSGDLDNRIKPVLDALIRCAYTDDDQIVEIHARRWEDKQNPRIEVRIEQATTLIAAETTTAKTTEAAL